MHRNKSNGYLLKELSDGVLHVYRASAVLESSRSYLPRFSQQGKVVNAIRLRCVPCHLFNICLNSATVFWVLGS